MPREQSVICGSLPPLSYNPNTAQITESLCQFLRNDPKIKVQRDDPEIEVRRNGADIVSDDGARRKPSVSCFLSTANSDLEEPDISIKSICTIRFPNGTKIYVRAGDGVDMRKLASEMEKYIPSAWLIALGRVDVFFELEDPSRRYRHAGLFDCRAKEPYIHVIEIEGPDRDFPWAISTTIHEIIHALRFMRGCMSGDEQFKLAKFLDSIPRSDLKGDKLQFPAHDRSDWADYYVEFYGNYDEGRRVHFVASESPAFLAAAIFDRIYYLLKNSQEGYGSFTDEQLRREFKAFVDMNDMADDPVKLTLTAINLNWMMKTLMNYSEDDKRIDGIWRISVYIFLDTVLEQLVDIYLAHGERYQIFNLLQQFYPEIYHQLQEKIESKQTFSDMRRIRSGPNWPQNRINFSSTMR